MPPFEQEPLKKALKLTSSALNEQKITDLDIARYAAHRNSQDADNAAFLPENTEKINVREAQMRIAEAMLIADEQTQTELSALMPEIAAYNTQRMDRLNADAQRSGIDKVKHDSSGRKKRAAKTRLKEINQLRSIVTDHIALQNGHQIPGEQAEEREIHRGRRWRNPLRAAMNHFALGSYKDRHGIVDGRQTKADYPPVTVTVGDTQEQIQSIPQTILTGQGTLKGNLYRPSQQRDTGKLVIFFSGSGGTNASMIMKVAEAYTKSGASVLGADYRGFGKSQSERVDGAQRERKSTHLCEASIYKDGRAIYNYAINKLGYAPSDIILHGFSLGGAVASKIAADVSEENSAQQGDVKLGGLVLHSSIDSMYNASKNAMGGLKGAGFLGWAGSGGYNTASHMRRLHRFDPSIPVHYRGGGGDDQLALSVTNLHKDPLARFANSSISIGGQGHQGMRGGGIYSDDVAANMNFDLHNMDRLARFGRNADLGASSTDPVGHF